MSNIIDHALSLILDDGNCAQFTDHRAAEILGRTRRQDQEDDSEWWEAKTKAVNELLADVFQRSSSH
ncbi:MAG: hypothetical protein GY927_11615 [bacterium]|nr:hypothetical protein [bacterium]